MLYLWIIFRINSRDSKTGNKQVSGTGENMQKNILVKILTKNRNTKRKLRPTAETILGQSQVWWSNCWVAKWCIVAAAAIAAVAGKTNWKHLKLEIGRICNERTSGTCTTGINLNENCKKETNKRRWNINMKWRYTLHWTGYRILRGCKDWMLNLVRESLSIS